MASQSIKHDDEKICELAPELKSLLRTGVALTSVTQCVEELVLNALDAGATCVAVRLDLSCFRVQVVDNGCGIAVDQLKKIGDRYSTSKCHTVEDLDNLNYFGYRGEAVASLRDSSSVLEITSRAKHSTQTFCKLFQQGKSLPVIESNTPRPSAGTTVTIHDLFYNFPVRKKSLSESIEFERIRQRIEGIALMRPSVSFTLRNNVTGNVVLQTHKTNSVLNAFTYLFGIARAKVMSEVQLTKDPFFVSGYIGKEGYSRKDLQFLYVNGRLVLKTRIHKLINNVIGKSMILRKKVGASKSNTTGDCSPAITSSPTKFSPRYAMFVINIVCPYTEYDITFEPAKTLVEFKCLNLLCSCVEELVLSFLKKENLYVGAQPLEKSIAEEEESKSVAVDDADITRDKSEDKRSNLLTGSSYAEGICTSNSRNFVTSKSVKRQIVTDTAVDHKNVVSEESKSYCGMDLNEDKVEESQVVLSSVSEKAIVSDSGSDEDIPKTPNIPCFKEKQESMNVKETHLSSSDDHDETTVENEADEEYETEDPFVKLAAIQDKGDNSNILLSEGREEKDADGVATMKSKSYIQIPTPYINISGGSALSHFRKMLKIDQSTNHSSSRSEVTASFSLKQKIAEMRKEKELHHQKIKENKQNNNKSALMFDQLNMHLSDNPTSSVTFPHIPIVSNEDENGKTSPAERQDCNVVESRGREIPSSALTSTVLEEEVNTGLPSVMDEQYTVIMDRENLVELNASVTSKLASMIQKKQLVSNKGNPEVLPSASSSKAQCTEQINVGSKFDFQEGTNRNYNLCPKVSRFSNYSNTPNENRSFLTTDSLIQTASQIFKSSGTVLQEPDNFKHSLSSKVPVRCGTAELLESEDYGKCFCVADNRSTGSINVACKQKLDVTVDLHSSDKTPTTLIAEQQNKNSQILELFTPSVHNENTSSTIPKTIVSSLGFLGKDEGSSCSAEDSESTDLYCYESVDSPPLCYEMKLTAAESTAFTNDNRIFYNSSQGFTPDMSSLSSSQLKNDERVFGLLVPQSQCFETSSNSWKEEQDNAASDSQGFIPVPHFSVNRTVSPAGSEGFTPMCSDDNEPVAADTPQPVQHEQSLSDTSESSQFLSLTHFLESSSSSIADLYSEDERIEKLRYRKRKCKQLQESIQLTSDTQKIKYPKMICQEDCIADKINYSSQSLVCDISKTKPLDEICTDSSEHKDVGIAKQRLMISNSCSPNLSTSDSLNKSIDNNQMCDINVCNLPYKDSQQNCDHLSVINSTNTEQTYGMCTEVWPETSLISANLISQTCQDCELRANEKIQTNSFTNNNGGKNYSDYRQASDALAKREMEVHKNIDEASSGKANPDGGLSTQWSDVDETELLAVEFNCENDQSPPDETDAVNNGRSTFEEIEPTGIEETWIEAMDPKTGDKLYVNQRTGHTKISTQAWISPAEVEDSSSLEKTSNNNVAGISPHSHDTLVQLMEEHFEQDEEEDGLASVKWKDKRRDSTDVLSTDKNVEKLFQEWENPVFELAEQVVQSPELGGQSSRGVNKAHRILNPCRFSKEMLQNLKVVGQVDKKFIACLTRSQTENLASEPDLMVLFDQHAVHERVRLECLTSEAYEEKNGQPTQFVRKYNISPAHCLQFSEEEVRIILSFQTEFQRIGVECTENTTSKGSVFIHTIPACMMERDYKPKKERDSVAWWLVEALIQEYVELLQTTSGSTGRLPQTLHKCLCSQACHGAIKFGEKLSVSQCEKLLDSLSKCKLPFQCAHGRPSVTPLLHMDKVQKSVVTRRPSLWKISRHVQPK